MAQTVSDTTNVQKPVNVVFQQTFLRRAQQVLPYFVGSQPGSLIRHGGSSTVKWRRFEQLTPSITALAELTATSTYMQGRDSDVPTFTDVTAAVAKYGQFYILNEEVDAFNPNGTMDELSDTLGEAAGRSLNMLQRNELEDNGTIVRVGGAGSDGAVVSAITLDSIKLVLNTLVNNSARPFTGMTTGSTNIATVPIMDSYWGLCHPDVAVDIAGLTGFKSVETYAGQVQTAPGEFGYLGSAGRGIRFIQSEDATVDANAGGSPTTPDLNSTSGSEADLYPTVILGRDAHGSVGLGKRHRDGVYRAGEMSEAIEMIVKPFGSGGIADPFNEIMTMAWKSWHAAKILNGNWIRVIRSGATNLAN